MTLRRAARMQPTYLLIERSDVIDAHTVILDLVLENSDEGAGSKTSRRSGRGMQGYGLVSQQAPCRSSRLFWKLAESRLFLGRLSAMGSVL